MRTSPGSSPLTRSTPTSRLRLNPGWIWHLYWLGGIVLPAPELIQDRLLPLAGQGLRHCGIDGDDIERFLEVIRQRVESRQTGADWLLKSCSQMGGDRLKGSALVAVTAATYRHQQQGPRRALLAAGGTGGSRGLEGRTISAWNST